MGACPVTEFFFCWSLLGSLRERGFASERCHFGRAVGSILLLRYTVLPFSDICGCYWGTVVSGCSCYWGTVVPFCDICECYDHSTRMFYDVLKNCCLTAPPDLKLHLREIHAHITYYRVASTKRNIKQQIYPHVC